MKKKPLKQKTNTRAKLKIDQTKLRKLEPAKDAFTALMRSIVYQQISTKAGNSIHARFLALFPTSPRLRGASGRITPEALLKLTDDELRAAGLSSQKVKYLRDLAAKFVDGTVDPKKFPTMTDEEIMEHLTAVKGIGPWTAHMFLIFALNRPNVLPVGDLAIRKGFQKAFNLRSMPDDKKMRKLAEVHEGEHTKLSLHLWRIVDEESGADWN